MPIGPAIVEGNAHLVAVLAFGTEDGEEGVGERCARGDELALAAQHVQPVDLQLDGVEQDLVGEAARLRGLQLVRDYYLPMVLERLFRERELDCLS